PALATEAERAERDAGGVEPGEAPDQFVRREERDRRTATALGGVLARQGGAARFACEIEITRLDQADFLRHAAQEGDPGLRQRNVDRHRELLADRAGRQSGGPA